MWNSACEAGIGVISSLAPKGDTMPFCSQCGKEMEATACFCPSCGASAGYSASQPGSRVSSVSPAAPVGYRVVDAASSALAARTKSAKIVAGALNALLVVCAFMPWVNVSLYIWSDSFSMPALLDMANTVREWGSSLGGISSDVDGALAGLTVIIVGILAIWLGTVVVLIRDAYRYFTSKEGFRCAGAAAMCALSVLFLLVVFALDQMVSSSSGVPSGIVSATGWVWGAIALSVAALIYPKVKEKELDPSA